MQNSLKKREAAYTILEKKFQAQKQMIVQLGEVNNTVVNENEQDVSLEQLLDESNFSHKESNVNLIKKLLSLPLYTNQLN